MSRVLAGKQLDRVTGIEDSKRRVLHSQRPAVPIFVKEGVSEAIWCFDDVWICVQPTRCQQRRVESGGSRIAGVRALGHRADISHQGAGTRCRNANCITELVRSQIEEM